MPTCRKFQIAAQHRDSPPIFIPEAGAIFGLSANWENAVAMPTTGFCPINEPNGTLMQCKSALVYLSGLLDATGNLHAKLNRGLGAARTDFTTLENVWHQLCSTPQRKFQISDAYAESQLLCCSHTAWRNNAKLRKSDDFHAKCLRTVPSIPHPFASTVSNCHIFHAASCWPYSNGFTLRQQACSEGGYALTL